MKRILQITALTLLPIAGLAAPAKPGLYRHVQPDGTVMMIRLVGDERFHMSVDSEGWPLEMSGGWLRRVEPQQGDTDGRTMTLRMVREGRMQSPMTVNGNTRAGEWTAPDSRHIGLQPGNFYPATGKQKGLIILASFADNEFKLGDPYDYFNRLANEPGFDQYGATGSARDWFIDNSMGLFTPDFDVVGPVKLPKEVKYYGENKRGNDVRAWEMIVDACREVDDAVDFKNYDCDGDGIIDNVFVFYAGMGESTGGGEDTIWPHQWEISAATRDKYYFDALQLESYACSNEWETSRPDGIGTFVHEFSHVLGLPDLYTTGGDGHENTPGDWSVLDVGCYLNNSCTPPNYSAYERWSLGWLEPRRLTAGEGIAIEELANNDAVVLELVDDKEYFFFETRVKRGWDKYLPGQGMLVWHVDWEPRVWYMNSVNNNGDHPYVDIVEADNKLGYKNYSADPFPGSKNVTSFGADTNAAFKGWDGEPTGYELTNIAYASRTTTFDCTSVHSGISATVADGTVTLERNGSALDLAGLTPGGDVRLFGISGRVMAEIKADSEGRASLSVAGLPRGVYLLQTNARTFKITI